MPGFVNLRLALLVVLVYVCIIVHVHHTAVLSTDLQRQLWANQATHPPTTVSSQERTNGRGLCPSTSNFFPKDELLNSIESATQFHTNGGNLKAIQKYLDDHMQHTLNELDVKFTMEDQNQPLQNSVDDLKNHFRDHNVKRGGYGQPLPGKFSGENTRLLADQRWMQVLEPWTSQRQITAMGPVGPSCLDQRKLGIGYEAKYMCRDPAALNATDVLKSNEDDCHLFSIGSNDQWGFEVDARKKLPQCQIHTFDCTLHRGIARRKPDDSAVHFYDRCIGKAASGEDSHNAKKYLGYEALVAETGIQAAPTYLKMDVEGFEFDVVLDWILEAPPNKWPEQIMMEVHWASRMVGLSWVLRQRQAAELSLFFAALFNRGGYLPVLAETFGKGCPTCLEVLLVKVLC